MTKISDTYFKESPREQSVIKKLIVVKYFKAWANIMKSNIAKYPSNGKLAYIDLFCGKGKHDTGETTAAVEIMEHILGDDVLSQKCLTIFNDCNKDHIEQLKENIESLDDFSNLKYHPIYKSLEVDDTIFNEIKDSNIVPSLSFIDPFGYGGVSVDLLNFLIRSFGCDLILFFNYNDINRAITNPKVKTHMESIFTPGLHDEMCKLLSTIDDSSAREKIILNIFEQAIQNKYNTENPRSNKKIYTFPFRFQFEEKSRTSHYVIFISKDILAVKIMKEIMWGLDNNKVNNIASFEFIPNNTQESFIDMLDTNFDDLKNKIIEDYKGSKRIVKNIINDYIETIYIGKNIKKALLELESENKINVINGRSRKNSMPDDAVLKFL